MLVLHCTRLGIVVKLEVLSNGAIYVNNIRITNRSTKPWGGACTEFSVDVEPYDAISVLKANGFNIDKIDPDYARECEIHLNLASNGK